MRGCLERRRGVGERRRKGRGKRRRDGKERFGMIEMRSIFVREGQAGIFEDHQGWTRVRHCAYNITQLSSLHQILSKH